jgi:hypothetical protein
MQIPFWLQWGVPVGALAFGVASYAWFWLEGRRLDRKYGKRG